MSNENLRCSEWKPGDTDCRWLNDVPYHCEVHGGSNDSRIGVPPVTQATSEPVRRCSHWDTKPNEKCHPTYYDSDLCNTHGEWGAGDHEWQEGEFQPATETAESDAPAGYKPWNPGMCKCGYVEDSYIHHEEKGIPLANHFIEEAIGYHKFQPATEGNQNA